MELHGRLLKGLLESAALTGLDGDGAWLLTPNGKRIVLIDGTSAGFAERIARAVARNKSEEVHVVVAGGGDEAGRSLRAAWPFWQLTRRFGFHHVYGEGMYERVKGARLPLIASVAERVRSLEPPTSEEMAQYAASVALAAKEQDDFAQAVKGHPWVTYSIAALCVALFALEELWGDSSSTLALLRMGANPGRAALRTPWTLLSSAFLHIGLMHLLFNMAALLSFGPLLERVLGWRRYVVLYALSALGGGMASALGHEVIVSAGASGALWGLMVGGAGLAVRPRDVLPRSVVGSMRKQVWTPVLINLVYSFQPGVDLLAHLGGGVVGGALLASGLLTIGVRREGATMTRSSGPLLQGAAALSALAMAASIAVALIVGQPWTMGSPPPMERREIGAMGLSIEVPVGFATTRDEHSVAFGRFDRDPIVVEVIHAAAGSPRSAEELAEGREAFGKVIDELRIEGATRVGAAVPVKVGALDTFRVIDKFGDIEARTWAVALEGGDALVRVYVTPGAPREWVALRDRFIASLRVAE